MEVADWYTPVVDIGLVLHLKKLNGLALIESKQLLGVAQDSVTSMAEFLHVSQFVLAQVCIVLYRLVCILSLYRVVLKK